MCQPCVPRAGVGGLLLARRSRVRGQRRGHERGGGTVVVADVGRLPANGTSEITPRRVHVTSATEFVRVERTRGAAASGWVGDYVETPLPRWDLRPGGFVTVTVSPGASGDVDAVKLTVVGAPVGPLPCRPWRRHRGCGDDCHGRGDRGGSRGDTPRRGRRGPRRQGEEGSDPAVRGVRHGLRGAPRARVSRARGHLRQLRMRHSRHGACCDQCQCRIIGHSIE